MHVFFCMFTRYVRDFIQILVPDLYQENPPILVYVTVDSQLSSVEHLVKTCGLHITQALIFVLKSP